MPPFLFSCWAKVGLIACFQEFIFYDLLYSTTFGLVNSVIAQLPWFALEILESLYSFVLMCLHIILNNKYSNFFVLFIMGLCKSHAMLMKATGEMQCEDTMQLRDMRT